MDDTENSMEAQYNWSTVKYGRVTPGEKIQNNVEVTERKLADRVRKEVDSV